MITFASPVPKASPCDSPLIVVTFTIFGFAIIFYFL
jgi:hypothetical protein